MPKLESYQKQAKLLVRWHRERNYSVGGKVRQLARFSQFSDAEVLAMRRPLTLAQEIVAVEAGFGGWADLTRSVDSMASAPTAAGEHLRLSSVVPILFVRDVLAAANFYASQLGFETDFLHGKPPFYGAVSRDGACLHLRLVHQPNFAELAERNVSLILASIEVSNVKALFAEYEARQVPFAQKLVRQAWGGLDFHVRDPDGNRISFVQYAVPKGVEATG